MASRGQRPWPPQTIEDANAGMATRESWPTGMEIERYSTFEIEQGLRDVGDFTEDGIEDRNWVRYADHKAQLEQAIAEFAERLAGELGRSTEIPMKGNSRDVALAMKVRADTIREAASLCRSLATEGRE